METLLDLARAIGEWMSALYAIVGAAAGIAGTLGFRRFWRTGPLVSLHHAPGAISPWDHDLAGIGLAIRNRAGHALELVGVDLVAPRGARVLSLLPPETDGPPLLAPPPATRRDRVPEWIEPGQTGELVAVVGPLAPGRRHHLRLRVTVRRERGLFRRRRPSRAITIDMPEPFSIEAS